MLSVGSAVALVRDSVLLDVEWYAAQVGATFASREEAAEHWVTRRPVDASPHPLFEPVWLYPGRRWEQDAPDPLSFYLSHPGARGRSPHPRYPQRELGLLEDWVTEHEVTELLPAPLARAPVAEVAVLVPADDLPIAVRWVRHLAQRSPSATAVVTTADEAARRVLLAVAADKPSVLVGAPPRAPVVVSIDAGIEPPRWGWLDELVGGLTAGVAATQPLLLHDDFTVASPLLVGLPVQDAERLAAVPLPHLVPGVVARRIGAEGTTRLVPSSRLFGPDHVPDPPGEQWQPLWVAAGFSSPRVPITVCEGVPALRWSIDIAAGAGPIGRRWGDWHFARSLADALERRGQWVAIDHPETRKRASRELDDVVLTLRGLGRVDPPGHTTNLLWVIYDSDQVTAQEAAAHDAVFAASTTWAARRSAEWGVPITSLLQCTDATRFHPGLAEPGTEALFVGNARGGMRPVVEAALDAGIDLSVIGFGWEAWLPTERAHLEATGIANEQLPARYAAAGVVLNDHHPAMLADGFVSNRVFDVLAVAGRLLSDPVPGLADVVGVDLPTWRSASDLAALARPPFDAFPNAAQRRALAERVVAEHSFDARAATLLEAALLHSRR